MSMITGLMDAVEHHTASNPKELCLLSFLCGGLCGIYCRIIIEVSDWLGEWALASGLMTILIPGVFIFFLMQLVKALYDSLSKSWKASQLNV